ncbi:MAG: Eco57I restriction-modification methylase domain-containing protein [Treponema sp.]|uniref:Eco57I restriction-modification methylase domain-containing protein n=1 Tax=Treponema sp. TaxID=166 RepID=UPI002A90998B|nr:Eco57I restriction-modification methylase domain-containing protein [Treponema sp.]MDY6396257.1 Eco57I restriction-modification methylase domain-containing protein [Treponema sp.]
MADSAERTFKNTFSYKLIYVFAIPDDAHAGSVKVGDTKLDTDLTPDRLQPNCKELNQAALERIQSYTKTAAVDVTLLHTELAIRTIQKKDGSWNTESFRDYDVHRVLLNSGIKKKTFGDKKLGNEWFCCDDVTAIKAITAVKHGDASIDTLIPMDKFIPISFRPEQKEAIEKTVRQFKNSPRMLWNAKMRFGKTLSALEVVRRMDFERTVLITHRPVVDDGWHEDFGKIFTKEDKYRYGSKKSGIEISDLEKTFKKDKKHYIYFASIQDLRGSKIVGGKFDKNDDVFNIDWDCVIIDEAHEGTTTELGDKVKSILFKPQKGTKLLELSGTPFNILSSYEDDGDSVFTWDYVMEQRAKQEWEETHFGDSNPYSDLPEMRMYTYDLGKLIKGDFVDVGDKAFNFTEFFRTDETGAFVHEKNVNDFLNLLTKQDKESLYPFSCPEYINLFHHTLWMVPGVKEALALQHLLEKHPVFCNFKIVNVAGDGDPEDPTGEALEAVRKAIKDAGDDGYTITLSCGKLTTGVSVKQWTAVFMLYGTYSTKAAGYLQTIFRVQTPCNEYGKSKTCAYVFDFAPDRTLKMVADAVTLNTKVGKTKVDDKNRLGEFLNFCPVIGIVGSTMKPYQVNSLLQQLKSAYAERAVTKGFDDASIYNDELLKLSKVELEKFKDLQAIIGQTKANKAGDKIDVNKQGFTEEEYQQSTSQPEKRTKPELTPEEQALREKLLEAKKQRQTAISILRGISIRMPLLIYGARGKNGDEIPITEDITLKKFVELVDDTSWEEFMPHGVTKENFADFEKYYDEDVFIAAGKRIRNLVLAADKLNVTERTRKIAEIFSYFRNPDKETVLTPWRVVNMHMGDCLGGWSFFDKDYEKSLGENESPHFIDVKDVTEKTLGNSEAKILEINSKTGLYPLYCAYSIFRAKRSLHPQMAENALWEETIRENIFVICKTPMAKTITQRTLCGFTNTKINAHAFDHLVNDLKNKSDSFIKDVTSENFWKKGNGKMEFDAIVGNPPYQEMDGGAQASANPIYNKFVIAAEKTKPNYVSMIMPSRWYAGGKGLDEFRDRMLNDICLQVLHDFLNPDELFPNTNIRGGLCYFLWNKNYDNSKDLTHVITHSGKQIISDSMRPMKIEGAEIFIRNVEAVSIIKKVSEISRESFENHVSSRKPFGLDTTFAKSSDFKSSKNGLKDAVECYGKGWKIGYLEKSLVKQNSVWIDDWKVFTARANNIGTELNDDNLVTKLGKPRLICTESYLLLGIGLNLNESSAKNLCKYFTTKFARFMHSLAKASQDATAKTYRFVPLQDFTSNSDIDWSQPIPEIDKQLYRKYGLSEEEIAFIEKMIRPMP